jgi:hypothetical protein
MIGKWLRRRYTKRVEDQAKVNKTLKSLNGGRVSGDWVAAEGLHTMLAVVPITGGQGVDGNHGVTVKVFFNTKTGEMKTYVANFLMSRK